MFCCLRPFPKVKRFVPYRVRGYETELTLLVKKKAQGHLFLLSIAVLVFSVCPFPPRLEDPQGQGRCFFFFFIIKSPGTKHRADTPQMLDRTLWDFRGSFVSWRKHTNTTVPH